VQAHYDAEAGKALKTASGTLRRAGANTTARLGSVASTVAVSCTRPLLVLRGDTAPRRDSLKVGIAVDSSPYGLAAARFVAQHRDFFGASPSVSLIRVVPDLTKITVPGWIEREVATGIRPEQARSMQEAAFEAAFKPARDELAHAGIAVTELRLVGHLPADMIAAQAVESRLDLLVLGSTGFGRARYIPMGSVAARVAARCPTALLLVRDKQGLRPAETSASVKAERVGAAS
jgi:nucleotide-binding universal stress UspA family protein